MLSSNTAKQLMRRVLPVMLLLWLGNATAAKQVTVDGQTFQDPVTEGGATLAMRGAMTYEYLFWTLYTAALYLPADAKAADVLSDVPKRLELVYRREIERDAFIEAGNTVLERSVAPAVLARIQPQIAQLHKAYQDVAEGDRYVLAYDPGVGTSLDFNGKRVVTVPGAEFAAAYFAIWLGAEPLDEALRDTLLGRGS
ncbi:MAG: chalcone isomerase family protein [Pseudomonadota bacterium]